MSQQQNQNDQELERMSKAAFHAAMAAVEPPPYLKYRILNRLNLKRKMKWMIQLIVPVVGVGCIVLVAGRVEKVKSGATGVYSAGVVNKDYVIDFNFSAKLLGAARSVELQLPDGIQFHSSHEAINRARKLRLAFRPLRQNMKLPFVIRALKAERAELKLRIFDQKGHELDDRTMAIRFDTNESAL